MRHPWADQNGRYVAGREGLLFLPVGKTEWVMLLTPGSPVVAEILRLAAAVDVKRRTLRALDDDLRVCMQQRDDAIEQVTKAYARGFADGEALRKSSPPRCEISADAEASRPAAAPSTGAR